MNKALKFLNVLSLATIFHYRSWIYSNVKAADYYIDTYNDNVSVWVVDTDKTRS